VDPTGQYTRKIWVLYEWLTGDILSIPDLLIKNFIPLIDEQIQFCVEGKKSSRHIIIKISQGHQIFVH